jgi:endonuclease/exonuclease/phosphatase (EEP) superfamily protein YafD
MWHVVQVRTGDSIWWIAITGSFSPFVFVPLMVFIPLALLVRKRAMTLSVVAPCALFLALYGHQFLPPPRVHPQSHSVAVTSFNVWGYSTDADALASAILANDADVVALQELSPVMRERLNAAFVNLYPYREYQPLSRSWGMAVYSRYPIAPHEPTLASDTENRVLAVELDLHGTPLILYNVHMPALNILAYVDRGTPLSDRVPSLIAFRSRIAERLIGDIRLQSAPVVLAGDLNGTARSDVYRLLTTQLTDAHLAAGRGFAHTFPAYGGSWRGAPIPPRLMRIDMILHSASLITVESRRSDARAQSNHHPVTAVIAIPPDAPD